MRGAVVLAAVAGCGRYGFAPLPATIGGGDDGALADVLGPHAGLVAYWPFDDGAGTTAHDATGHGYDLALTGGPAWTTGNADGALALDGIDDSGALDTNTPADLTFAVWPAQDATIAAWIRDDTPAASLAVSHELLAFTDVAGITRVVGLGVDTSGTRRVLYGSIDLSGAVISASAGDLTLGWHHVTVTLQYEPMVATVYVDGTSATGGSLNTAPQSVIVLAVLVGRGRPATSFVAGAVDDLRIYDHLLTAAEIHDLYVAVGGT